MLRNALILLSVSLSSAVVALAQGTQGRFGDTELQQMRERRPLLVSGNVVLASGEPLAEPILIKRICGTRITPEAYTDAKGHFLFELGGTSSMAVMDSSSTGLNESRESGSSGASFGGLGKGDTATTGMDFTGCTVVADAPGFRSNPIALGRRRSLERSDIGTFTLTPIEGVQVATISVNSASAPKKAQTAYFKALEMLRDEPEKKTDQAIAELEKAIKIYPEYAAAWTALGQARLQLGDAEEAKAALEEAIAADPQYIRPYVPLVRIAVNEQDWGRALELSDVVLSADATNTQIRWFRAVAQFELRELEDAAVSLNELQSDEVAERQFPQTHHLLGMIYASRGEITEAASEYQRYLELAPEAEAAAGIQQQLDEWKNEGAL